MIVMLMLVMLMLVMLMLVMLMLVMLILPRSLYIYILLYIYMNIYNIDVPLCTNVSKTYSYEILNKFNSQYSGPIEWIPFWFYTQYDPNADNAHFVIHGDFHSTYPNEPHLSINVILSDGFETGMLHVSQDPNGFGYLQELGYSNAGKLNKQTKRKYNKHNYRKNKHKSTKHRKHKHKLTKHKLTKHKLTKNKLTKHKKTVHKYRTR
jgi:hypothetical protein